MSQDRTIQWTMLIGSGVRTGTEARNSVGATSCGGDDCRRLVAQLPKVGCVGEARWAFAKGPELRTLARSRRPWEWIALAPMNDAADDLRCTRRLLACLRLGSSSGSLLPVAANGTDTMLARLVAVRETQEKKSPDRQRRTARGLSCCSMDGIHKTGPLEEVTLN